MNGQRDAVTDNLDQLLTKGESLQAVEQLEATTESVQLTSWTASLAHRSL